MADASYRRMPGSEGERREFRITVGLREGYSGTGRIFGIEEAVRAAHAWMRRRAEAGKPVISGMFTRGEVLYATSGPDGIIDREPVAILTGEILPAASGHLTDEEVVGLLDDIAAELGRVLGQDDVHVAFRNRTWTLHRDR